MTPDREPPEEREDEGTVEYELGEGELEDDGFSVGENEFDDEFVEAEFEGEEDDDSEVEGFEGKDELEEEEVEEEEVEGEEVEGEEVEGDELEEDDVEEGVPVDEQLEEDEDSEGDEPQEEDEDFEDGELEEEDEDLEDAEDEEPEAGEEPEEPGQATERHDALGVAAVAAALGDAHTPAEGGVPPGMIVPPGYQETPMPDEPRRLRFGMWARFLTASAVIVVSVAAATAASLLLYLSDIAGALGHGRELHGVRHQLASIQGGDPETILILGSDHRPGIPGSRSDTAILLRLDPNRNAIALLSIPRDLKVNIPGHGPDKFNDAYTLGGPKLTLKLVRRMTGLKINHLVNVNFKGFAEAVTAVGCVYIDVDHNYYHSNSNVPVGQQYADINLKAGYQRLCGEQALSFVRYRHDDNDLVRAARQHEFLREVRQRISPEKLFFSERKQLIGIFTKYTTSDIDDPETMLQVLKLFIASRNAPIKEIHFPVRLGPSYVYSTPGKIHAAVRNLLGFEATPGPRLGEKKKKKASAKHTAKKKTKGKSKPKKKRSTISTYGMIDSSSTGRQQAAAIQPQLTFHVYYPTLVPSGTSFPEKPRSYTIGDPSFKPYRAYKLVMKTPQGEYFGLMGTRWMDPFILKNPSATKTINGHPYQLYYDANRLRMISWKDSRAVYWLSNTLLESITKKQMEAMAASLRHTGIPAKFRSSQFD